MANDLDQERKAFRLHFAALCLEECADAWGGTKFRYSHVESLWAGWKARAALAAAAAPCDHIYEARPIDGSNSASAPCVGVCRKCGHVPNAALAAIKIEEITAEAIKKLVELGYRYEDGAWVVAGQAAPQAREDARPVGTLECHLSGAGTFWPDEKAVLALPIGDHPLYTTPQPAAQAAPAVPEWRGLTDPERYRIAAELMGLGTGFVAPILVMVEDIEKRLRERNAAPLTTQGASHG